MSGWRTSTVSPSPSSRPGEALPDRPDLSTRRLLAHLLQDHRLVQLAGEGWQARRSAAHVLTLANGNPPRRRELVSLCRAAGSLRVHRTWSRPGLCGLLVCAVVLDRRRSLASGRRV
jgi:hypothetical protein